MSIAARHNLVLETGHSSPAESLLLIDEAKRQGVKHIMVTHALSNPGGPLSIAEIARAAKMGAYIELVYTSLTDSNIPKVCGKRSGAAGPCVGSDIERSRAALQPAAPGRPSRALSCPHGSRHYGIRNHPNVENESRQTPTSPKPARPLEYYPPLHSPRGRHTHKSYKYRP